MIERIVYTSKAIEGLEQKDVFGIIRTAHNRNSAFSLSGALIFIDGYFLQVLEGESFRLRERFQAIDRDERHTDVLVREHQEVPDRLFPNDWMALRQGHEVIDLVRQLPQYASGFPSIDFSVQDLLGVVEKCYTTVAAQRHL